jgi:O-antigen ligase
MLWSQGILLHKLMIILFFAASPLINQGLNWLRVSSFEENFLDRARSIYDLEEHSNVGRLIIWRDSLKYSLIHPLGVGYGNFVVTLVKDVSSEMSFEDVASQKNLRYNLPQKFVSAHSLYLSVLVELGFVGLLILLVGLSHYLIFVGKFLWKHRFDNNFYLFFIASILFTNIWIAGYSFFDVTIFNDRVFSYFLIGLALQGIIMRNYQNLVSERTPDA